MSILSLVISAAVALNSLGQISIHSSHLKQSSYPSILTHLPDLLKRSSSFILRPVDSKQLETLKKNTAKFLIKNIPPNPKYFTIKELENQNFNNICSATIKINTPVDMADWPELTQAQYRYRLSSLSDADNLRKLYKKDPKLGIKVAQNCISQATALILLEPEKYETLLKYLELQGINLKLFLYAIAQKETGISDSEGNIIIGAGSLPDAGNGNGLFQIVSLFQFNNRHEYIPDDSFIWFLVINNIIFNTKSGATVLTFKLVEITEGNLSEERLLQVSILTLLASYNAAADPYEYARHVIAIYNRILETPTLPASYKEQYKPIPQI
jgi:hypothetical protein